ncbi:complex III assembly factor LYRM7 [Sitophilus oryzae]|uniref:Complex III assembly factor LYRM7 n=1 Tax=Sitophilus oryzae TaxID=7048 RepID=A0A6J2XK72_SITOR|nr:complex III assembly factor LYRM7 [Sitophilus oryzae]
MSNNLRKEVLRCFKTIHKTRQNVFKGDDRALSEGRKKINEEFDKYKHIQDEEAIKELLNQCKAVELELRTCVIQAKEVAPNLYQAEITQDTLKLDNIPFNATACCSSSDSAKRDKRKNKGGCGS